MSDFDRFNDQCRETEDERNERLALIRKHRAALTMPGNLIEWANKIDNRLGPISGRDADALAIVLRETANRLKAEEVDLQHYKNVCGAALTRHDIEYEHAETAERERNDLRVALEAAMHALRSFQYGNASEEFATAQADACCIALAKAREEG